MTDNTAHLLHPRTPAEQLQRIFDGEEPGDDGLIAALSRQVLAERDQLADRVESAEVCQQQAEDYARAYADAFERLHGRVVGTCDLDAAEAPPPSETYWADQIERLLHDARQLADGIDPMGTPEPTPHLVTVTHHSAAIDPSDTREHEYLVADHTGGGWFSHLVQHSATCNLLPYGKPCWFDDEWNNGAYSYENVAPGQYHVLPAHQDVGDHLGEFSHTEDYLDYTRIGDAPERTAAPTPAVPFGTYSEEPPF